jgi:hypothetical protein
MLSTDEEKVILNNSTKYLVFVVLFLLITLGTFFAIYQLISDRSLVLSFEIFSEVLFLKLIGVMFIYLILDGLRLYYVLKSVGVHIKYRYIFKLVFINIFISNVTPFATGGGFAQVYFLNKRGVSVGDASAASLIRTFLAVAFFILTVPVIVIMDSKVLNIFPSSYSIWNILFFVGLYTIIISGIYYLIMKPSLIEKIIHKALRFAKKKNIISQEKAEHAIGKIDEEIDKLSGNINGYLHGNKLYIALSIIFTVLFLFVLFYFSVLLIKDLNPEASGMKIFISQLIITALMYLAPTPGATGVAESAFTLMFIKFISKKNIITVIFSWRLFSIYIPMIIGMVIFYFYIFFEKSIQKGARVR